MHVEEIDLRHGTTIRGCFRSLKTSISDFSFANVYLFREKCRYRFVKNDDPVISCTTDEGEPCWMPLRDLRLYERKDLIRLMKDHGVLFPVPEEWVDIFRNDAFSVSCLESEMDYLYRVETMATFKGGRLNRKRNRLKQFLSLYEHDSALLTADRRDDARKVLDAWQAETGLSREETDYEPCREALNLMDRLDLLGMIYYAERGPAGFLIGEKLCDRTFVIHFAKGIKSYKGLYEYMFNDGAKRLISRYDYLNLEEDLGQEALRVTKSSYGPDRMVRKFRVRLNV
jgi:hypothetical protein